MSDAERSAIHPRIVVAGAGSIGCFVGGMLARSGCNVTLLLRAATLEEISQNGLTLTDYAGLDVALSPDSFAMDTDPACLAEADIVLVTVKSEATAKIAGEIAHHAPKNAVIVSLQNGVENAANLQAALPEYDARAGMVPFNVVWVGGGRFHRGTSGDIAIAQGGGHVGRHLSCPDLAVYERRDMAALQWGKLVINLNNALNALSGLPLRVQIGDRRWRGLMAAQMEEALGILEGAAIRTQNPVAALPMRHVPTVLRLPTWLFRVAAKTMLSIDPNARSSMWEDLDRGRATEIDELQGQIVRLAEQLGHVAPINAGVAELIREAVAAGAGAPGMPIQELQERLRRA
ncbi:2-dehydropantoate 2-reductase [Shimia sp. MMG029]|uniref:2-dehydropantoate 2-reductase n=1 Tax=Shimia sp. MMG029 TaxID=3021978 RepID=UPI0022FE4E3E|nr:2-dehydropantoate 2-reductase [Shimia sp. MMG029]MDA5558212.1 2-dehydropantoate 2-reductase [Shimia sp. MMG029]